MAWVHSYIIMAENANLRAPDINPILCSQIANEDLH